MEYERFQYMVAQSCEEYKPKDLINIISNGEKGVSCYSCNYYINKKCEKNIYDNLVNNIFRNN